VDLASHGDYDDFSKIAETETIGLRGQGVVVSESKSLLLLLSDPRIALYATSHVPVWLWSADATRILWR
jgi:hypothetical protein